MSDLLSIALTGVQTYTRALDVVADNVANAATPGHARRTTSLSPAMAGGPPIPLYFDREAGSGVRLTSIDRAMNALQADTLRRAEGQVAALDTSKRWLTTLQSTLTGSAGIDEPMNDLFNSLSDLTSDPTNSALRQTFLAKADALAQRFNQSASELDLLQQNIVAEADMEVRTLNSLARGLAEVNTQLRRTTAGSGTAASLADERDRILAQMSVIVGFDVQFDARGQATVRIPDAGGPTLVEGGEARSARILEGGSGFELRVGPKGADETAPITTGVFAGLSSARVLVSEAQARLDHLAGRVAQDFNQAQGEGVDLTGADGTPLFSTTAPHVRAAAANGADARVAATLADGATLVPSTLVFDGSDWTLSNTDGNSVTGALPLTLDGLTVSAPAASVNGDVYEIGAASPAAAIRLRALSPDQLALSARWLGEAAQTNSGSGGIELANDAAAAIPGTAPFTATVLAGGGIEVTDSLGAVLGSGSAGNWIGGDGFQLRLTGALAEGDTFRIEQAGANEGNNRNAVAMLSIRDRSGPAGTIASQVDAMVSSVTTSLAEARARQAVATSNRNGAAEALQESSGVDLNTEAAEMLRLQQAFQANARIIQTARDTFDAILAAGR